MADGANHQERSHPEQTMEDTHQSKPSNSEILLNRPWSEECYLIRLDPVLLAGGSGGKSLPAMQENRL